MNSLCVQITELDEGFRLRVFLRWLKSISLVGGGLTPERGLTVRCKASVTGSS